MTVAESRFSQTIEWPAYASHRGGHFGPEGTMATIARGRTASSAQIIECDLQLLADDTVVLLHDATIDHTASPASPIITGDSGTFTLAQWHTILHQDLEGSYPDEIGATLAQLAAGHGAGSPDPAILMPEIKTAAEADVCLAALEDLGLGDRSIVQSFSLAVARASAARGFEALFLIAPGGSTDWPDIKAAGIDHVCRRQTRWTSDAVAAATSAGLRTWAVTPNTTDDRDALLAMGVEGFITDRPDLLAPVVESDT